MADRRAEFEEHRKALQAERIAWVADHFRITSVAGMAGTARLEESVDGVTWSTVPDDRLRHAAFPDTSAEMAAILGAHGGWNAGWIWDDGLDRYRSQYQQRPLPLPSFPDDLVMAGVVSIPPRHAKTATAYYGIDRSAHSNWYIGRQVPMPDVATGSGLDAIAATTGLLRGPGETDDGLRSRILRLVYRGVTMESLLRDNCLPQGSVVACGGNERDHLVLLFAGVPDEASELDMRIVADVVEDGRIAGCEALIVMGQVVPR